MSIVFSLFHFCGKRSQNGIKKQKMGFWNNALVFLVFRKSREYRYQYQAKCPTKQNLKPNNQADNVIKGYSVRI
jgi:hypothetical protein